MNQFAVKGMVCRCYGRCEGWVGSLPVLYLLRRDPGHLAPSTS